MSDGFYKPNRSRKTRRQRKNPTKGLNCQIVTYPALTFSSKWIGHDFYTWVNKEWISDTTIPPFEADFGASEEIEECIEDEITSIFNEILANPKPNKEEILVQNLHASFDHSRAESLVFIKEHIERANCIQSVRDILKHMGILCRFRLPCIFSIEYANMKEKRLKMSLIPNIPGMAPKLYDSPEFVHTYKDFLHKVGKALGIDKLENVVPFEKKMVQLFDNDEDEKLTSAKGYYLARKFKLPWDAFFEAVGFAKWETTELFYRYPKMIRKLRILLNQVPLSLWKAYIIKCYLTPIIKYMGEPFEGFYHEFTGKYLQGKEKPMPHKENFLHFTYDSLPDIISKLFWQRCGDQDVITGTEKIAETINKAAISRMRENSWLSMSSKVASIEKIKAIKYKIGRPENWEDIPDVELSKTDFIKNRFLLGEAAMQKMFTRLGKRHTFWEEGIYRVNAYYYSEFNEIVFPYGILVSPFYRKSENPTWNYGGIGATFGHELCHAFDDEGKEYDQYGMVRRWWTERDIRRYKKKAKALEKIYSSVKVLGKHLDGENTLSENIADIAGLSICLEALRTNLCSRGITGKEEIAKEYRIFFISYATSWRTLYRNKRLKSGIVTDVHAPAYVRVNMVVSQMDEWYEAFDIDSHSTLYVKPEDRIRFF